MSVMIFDKTLIYNYHSQKTIMGLMYVGIFTSFIILIVLNMTFLILNGYLWLSDGIQSLGLDQSFIENIYYSLYLKWIILVNVSWILLTLIFMLKRKHYKTNSDLHYLRNLPVIDPKICVVIPTYNEEKNIGNMIHECFNQKFVEKIIVVDNNSSDKTTDIAEKEKNVIVIKKKINKGHTHSCVMGLKESLKTDTNIVALIDADGTFSPNDLNKLIPYLDNCDLVIGSRQHQVITEKGNQNSMFYVWGNLFLAKLLQLKYFSLLHLGVVQLTDVGCTYRCIKKESLKKIMHELTNPSNPAILKPENWLFSIYMTMLAIENDLKIVEIPITFGKRHGISKSNVDVKSKGIIYGLKFLWFILYR
tara:strand:+ start:2341 stop:3426 length:1086 start_codon:yes stop_codon:yes gene_type:complete